MNSNIILITGINGFVGNYLRQLVAVKFSKARIYGIDRTSNSNGRESIALDLLDSNTVTHFISDIHPDYIFHMAGVIYSQDWNALYQGNVQTTINLINAVRKSSPHCRIIIPGSAAEYGNVAAGELPITENCLPKPLSAYGVSKLWQTIIAQYYSKTNIDVVIGRMFNLIGTGLSENLVVGAVIKQIKKIKNGQAEPRIFVGNAKTKRDFIDIMDGCNALIHLALEGRTGEIYNICSGGSVSIENIVKMIINLSGMHIVVTVNEELIRTMDIENSYGSNIKILSDTKWQRKISLQESISQIMCEN